MKEQDAALLRQGVAVGRIVHYVAYNNAHLAGMIVNVKDSDFFPGVCDLVIFTAMENVAGEQNFGIQFHQKVQRSELPMPGTWHYPEHVA